MQTLSTNIASKTNTHGNKENMVHCQKSDRSQASHVPEPTIVSYDNCPRPPPPLPLAFLIQDRSLLNRNEAPVFSGRVVHDLTLTTLRMMGVRPPFSPSAEKEANPKSEIQRTIRLHIKVLIDANWSRLDNVQG